MPHPELPADDEAKDPTIALSERDAREAVRLLGLLSEALRDPQPAAHGPTAISSEELILRARIVMNSRRLRYRYFKRAMFGEPAWEILLNLYITEGTEGRQSIGRLADLVKTPLSTTARWIDYLERERLVEREPHPTDRRVIYIRLLAKARELLEAYLSGTPWAPIEDSI
jgi:DNA-binding MarR family transcriptional regulator